MTQFCAVLTAHFVLKKQVSVEPAPRLSNEAPLNDRILSGRKDTTSLFLS